MKFIQSLCFLILVLNGSLLKAASYEQKLGEQFGSIMATTKMFETLQAGKCKKHMSYSYNSKHDFNRLSKIAFDKVLERSSKTLSKNVYDFEIANFRDMAKAMLLPVYSSKDFKNFEQQLNFMEKLSGSRLTKSCNDSQDVLSGLRVVAEAKFHILLNEKTKKQLMTFSNGRKIFQIDRTETFCPLSNPNQINIVNTINEFNEQSNAPQILLQLRSCLENNIAAPLRYLTLLDMRLKRSGTDTNSKIYSKLKSDISANPEQILAGAKEYFEKLVAFYEMQPNRPKLQPYQENSLQLLKENSPQRLKIFDSTYGAPIVVVTTPLSDDRELLMVSSFISASNGNLFQLIISTAQQKTREGYDAVIAKVNFIASSLVLAPKQAIEAKPQIKSKLKARAAIQKALRPYWNIISGSPASYVKLVLVVEFNKDGSVKEDKIRLISSVGGDDKETKTAFRSATTAIKLASRNNAFDLPPESFEFWQSIELKFDPTQ